MRRLPAAGPTTGHRNRRRTPCPTSCFWPRHALMPLGSGPSKADVVHFLDGREDPDVDDAIRAYQKAAFAAGKRAPEAAEEVPELTALVQRKYVAAQIVEVGIQVGSSTRAADEGRLRGGLHSPHAREQAPAPQLCLCELLYCCCSVVPCRTSQCPCHRQTLHPSSATCSSLAP